MVWYGEMVSFNFRLVNHHFCSKVVTQRYFWKKRIKTWFSFFFLEMAHTNLFSSIRISSPEHPNHTNFEENLKKKRKSSNTIFRISLYTYKIMLILMAIFFFMIYGIFDIIFSYFSYFHIFHCLGSRAGVINH